MTATDTRLADTVTLKEDGLFVEDEKLVAEAFLGAWRNRLEIEPGTTVGAFLRVLRELPEQDLEAIEHITDSNVKPFLDELDQPAGVLPHPQDVTAIMVQRYAALRHYQDHKWLEDSVDVSGISADEDQNYAVDFTPVSVLATTPIYEARSGVFEFDPDTDDAPYDPKATTFDMSMTLGEFTEALLDEVTWFGTPDQRDARLSEIIGLSDEFASGEGDYIPWDEIKAKCETTDA